LTLLFTFTACSGDDDNGNTGDGPAVGANEITFDISGAVEGDKSGCLLCGDRSRLSLISFQVTTAPPGSDQTFSLVVPQEL
jgi:hypothetical protein